MSLDVKWIFAVNKYLSALEPPEKRFEVSRIYEEKKLQECERGYRNSFKELKWDKVFKNGPCKIS